VWGYTSYTMAKKPAKIKDYNHLAIEKKWQKIWDENKTYKTLPANTAKGKKPFYILDMFPYPSGAGLHVGHPRGYIGSDVLAHQKRMQGYNVLHPMGFDSFGLPAEQYAIQTGKHPAATTKTNIIRYTDQLKKIGLSFDWTREVTTSSPEYYKWTQWIFLQLYNSYYDVKKNKAQSIDQLVKIFETKGNKDYIKNGNAYTTYRFVFSAIQWKGFTELKKQETLMHYRLAFEADSEVNWCQELGTVLANDEIVDKDGQQVSERGEYPVEKMTIRQWSMRITAYAERLISGLDSIDFPEHIKTIQNNWIGKSEGAEIDFAIVGSTEKITVFTTRADTLFGVSAIVLSPEHAFIEKNKINIQNYGVVETYIRQVKNKTNEERTENNDLSAGEAEKTGVELKGINVINPVNGEVVPVWVADYVLSGYGTGAVMSVPAHDERDFVFANKYKLDVKEVLQSIYKQNTILPFTDMGELINSGAFSGMPSEKAKTEITKFVGGRTITNYKMRDAIFARQRYWGEPIPLYRDKNGIIHEVKKLPLELPNVKSYEPTGKAEGPLAGVKAWTAKGYETNTMPGWAGSSWYFLRYMDPKNKKALVGDKEIAYWKNVDVYVGGAEHVTGHLLYSRFWHKFLKDIGVVNTEEPFKKMYNQGLILASDGRKMSKRWGNVINPDDIIKTFGADTLRIYEMFMGPFTASQPWNTESIIGSRRFIERVWRLGMKIAQPPARPNGRSGGDHSKSFSVSTNTTSAVVATEIILHKTIKKVTEDIENFTFNTAISSLMICLNELESVANSEQGIAKEDFKIFLQLLAPFAPHVTDELWTVMDQKQSIHLSVWPKYNPKKIVSNTVTIGVQVNGKVRAEITIPTDAKEDEVKQIAMQNEKVLYWLEGKTIQKIIYVPGRLINIAAV